MKAGDHIQYHYGGKDIIVVIESIQRDNTNDLFRIDRKQTKINIKPTNNFQRSDNNNIDINDDVGDDEWIQSLSKIIRM